MAGILATVVVLSHRATPVLYWALSPALSRGPLGVNSLQEVSTHRSLQS